MITSRTLSNSEYHNSKSEDLRCEIWSGSSFYDVYENIGGLKNFFSKLVKFG